MCTDCVLEARNLTKRYNGLIALDGVNLKIREGEFVSIMGASGSGKSTLLNLMGALDRPTEGEVVFRGTPLSAVRDIDEFRSKEVGFVFQSHNLIPTLTALENVGVPTRELAISEAERRMRAEEALAAVGLSGRIGHRPSQLSGGERQRVAIARALVNDPEMILADEPTGELDSVTGEEVFDLMKDINRNKGKTIVVVTHNPEIAKKTDRIVRHRDGRVERDEPVRSELLMDLVSLRDSTLGKAILRGETVRDDNMERLGIFQKGQLGRRGELLRELLSGIESR